MTVITGNGTAVSGLGGPAGYGETMLSRADDASLRVNVGAVFQNGFQFGAQTVPATDLYVSTNGLISFGGAVNGVQADLAAITRPFIAAFHADVDTRLDGEGAESGPVWIDIDPTSDVVTITWEAVGFYRRNASVTNTFQIQLYDQGSAGMDIVLRYGAINWTTGDLEGGWNGLGGMAAQVGWRLSGSGAPTLLPASGIGADLLNLDTTLGNTGVSGLWVYSVAQPRVVNGTAANDLLVGAATTDDALYGGSGNDTLRGLGGADQMFGGIGTDFADYSLAAGPVVASLSLASLNTSEAAGDAFNLIEGLIGSAFSDSLTGDSFANTLRGQAGNDTLRGADGADSLDGGNGNDLLFGGDGADSLNGGGGIDTVSYADLTAGAILNLATPSRSSGSALGDVLTGIETIIATAFNDTILGASLNDRIYAAAGNDRLYGGSGTDFLAGEVGNDSLYGGLGADTLDGGEGEDIVVYSIATTAVLADLATPSLNSGDHAAQDHFVSIEGIVGSKYDDRLFGNTAANRLYGHSGNDIISGRDGDDRLDGGAGNDTLIGGAGGDYLIGNTGFDLADYSASTIGLTIDMAQPALNTGDAWGDRYSGIEAILGSAHGDRLRGASTATALYGGAGDDQIAGLGGADTLDGGAGNDTLIGGGRADQIIGGGGIDTASYDTALAGVTVNLTQPGLNTLEASGDSFNGIENLHGSAFADNLTGDVTANLLTGGAGNDSLSGSSGNDTLEGGTGADRLYGGAGIDLASYASASAGVTAQLSQPSGNLGDAAGDLYDQIEGLVGSSHADRLAGGTAADFLYGAAGNDYLFGGFGADRLDGGMGFDWASYTLSTAGVTVDMLTPGASTGDATGDLFFGIEGLQGSLFNDRLSGDAFANQLDGSNGNDQLYGREGNDVLVGGAGTDSLYGGSDADTLRGGKGSDHHFGGAGADVFQLLGTDDIGDLIRDYNPGEGDSLLLESPDFRRADIFVAYQNQPGRGSATIAEALVTHAPTGRVLWIVEDGDALQDLFLKIGSTSYDLI
jgi:Ca2+-binding RTX toxin-like protein